MIIVLLKYDYTRDYAGVYAKLRNSFTDSLMYVKILTVFQDNKHVIQNFKISNQLFQKDLQ